MVKSFLTLFGILVIVSFIGCKDQIVTLGSEKEIASFGIASPAATGAIAGTDIAVTVPYGTDVSALVATFTATGISVAVTGSAQISGTTVNDFTYPVTYTVTAEDSSTQDFVVTITKTPATSEKEITAFGIGIPAATGAIIGTDIAVTVPYGTDVSTLVATFTITGISIAANGSAQVSGNTVNDFTYPVTYTVTAEDDSTRDFVITISITPPPASEGLGFESAVIPGDISFLSVGDKTQKMIFANDLSSITFPKGMYDDQGPATLTHEFFIAETEITSEVVAAVFQWAYENNWFDGDIMYDHNGLDGSRARYGNQNLMLFAFSHVAYDGAGTFSVEPEYVSYPATGMTWYGAVLICNWLTEMRDGGGANLVYSNIDTDWYDDETNIAISNSGYRLPSWDEWEYAARYRGSDSTNTVNGYANPYFTQGDSACGAIADYTNEAACQAVAVYNGQSPVPTEAAEVKSLGMDSANTLGLYDMSGNVSEWCFNSWTPGGSYGYADQHLQIGAGAGGAAGYFGSGTGFRLCRTAD
jgi:formylglycine-generating enzyme required for sulfatase activity